MKILQGFALSFSMLSIIPFFKVHNFFKGINGYAVMFYPLVGVILGTLLYTLHTILTPYFPPQHLAIFIFSMWVVITGGLHLDGFSDTIDGLFVSKQKALNVMKDSHVGGMGMIFSVVFLILKASSILYLDNFFLLLSVMMLARFGAVLSIYFFPYISNGMGLLAKQEFSKTLLFITILYVFLFNLLHIELLLISILTSFSISYLFRKRYGGLSGDMYGFIIEVCELVLLNVIML